MTEIRYTARQLSDICRGMRENCLAGLAMMWCVALEADSLDDLPKITPSEYVMPHWQAKEIEAAVPEKHFLLWSLGWLGMRPCIAAPEPATHTYTHCGNCAKPLSPDGKPVPRTFCCPDCAAEYRRIMIEGETSHAFA